MLPMSFHDVRAGANKLDEVTTAIAGITVLHPGHRGGVACIRRRAPARQVLVKVNERIAEWLATDD